jgi:hypothetical protein
MSHIFLHQLDHAEYDEKNLLYQHRLRSLTSFAIGLSAVRFSCQLVVHYCVLTLCLPSTAVADLKLSESFILIRDETSPFRKSI